MCHTKLHDHRIFELLNTTSSLIQRGNILEALLPMVELYRMVQGTSELPISETAKERLSALTNKFVAITTDYIGFAQSDLSEVLFEQSFQDLVGDILTGPV